MRKRYALLAGPIVAVALAGCGGGSGDPEAAIEATVRTAVLSHDAAKCTEAMTAALREEVSGKSGKDALEDCEEEAVEDKHDTKAVAVSNVKVHGDHASAEAAYTGGTFGGQTIVLSLVEAGGRWKVDQVVRISKFDRKRLLAGAAVNLTDKGEASPDQGRCIVARLGRKTRAQIEAVLLNRDDAAEIELVRACPNGHYRQPATVQISNAIQTLVVGDEPSACLEFATQHYLEQITGETGTAAIAACAQAAESSDQSPETKSVSDIHVTGSRAQARVAIRSAEFGDDVLILGLVREYGHWKIDNTDRLLSIDRLAFAKGVLEGFTAVGKEVTPQASRCVLAKAQQMSLRQFEALLFPLDRERDLRFFGPCVEATAEAPPTT